VTARFNLLILIFFESIKCPTTFTTGKSLKDAIPLSLRQQQNVNSKEELVISDNLLALLPKKVTYLHSLDQDHISILLS